MSDCCVTTSPKIIIKPNSCSKNTVQASRSDSSVGIGCVPSTPRDLIGDGLLVTMYYYDAAVDQTVFQGVDRNGNTLQNASKESSLVLVNGVVLDNDQYELTEVTLTLDDGCETDTDIVSVVVFREPKEAEGDGSGQITTVNVLTIPPDEKVARPVDQPASLELVTTQFDANWFLNDRIEEVEKKVDGFDISDYALTAYVDSQDADLQTQIDALSASGGYNDAWIQPAIDSGDSTALSDAKAYTDQEIAAIPPTDLSDYATKKESTDGDVKALQDANNYTDSAIGNIPPVDLSDYEKITKSEADDANTLKDAKEYTDKKIDAIHIPEGGSSVTVSTDEPSKKKEGDLWFDNAEDTMQLSVFHVDSSAWLPVAPPLSLEGRVSTGEAVQRQIVDTLSTLDDYAKTDFVLDVKAEITTETDQKLLTYLPKSGGGVTGTISMGTNKITNLGDPTSNKDAVNLEKLNAELSTKLANFENSSVVQDWRIRSPKGEGSQTYVKIADHQLHLYHVADPTNDEHGVSRGYADQRYQIVQEPLVIKTTGSMECSVSNSPGSMKFCGLYNTSPGSSTNANMYFGNWNAGMRVALDGMKTSDGAEFAQNQKYVFNGYVTVVGSENGKVYFKHAVDMIQRAGANSYLTIHFSNRVPTYATGQNNSESKYVVTIEGYRNKQVSTLNIPDEEVD